MSNLEHLMENALVSQQRQLLNQLTFEEAHDQFTKNEINIEMAAMEHIPIEAVWEMALYVTQTWNEFAIQDFLKDRDQ